MSHVENVFEPSHYEAGAAHGLLSEFDPGTRTLPAGYQIDPRFRSLPTDIVLDKDVAVTMRDGITIYVDVLRPPGAEQVPVIVAWSPYGKSQGTAPSITSLFAMIGVDNAALSGLEKFEGPTRRTGARRATRSATPIRGASRNPKATARCSDAKRPATATT
jgi:uncharacterized protein